MLYQTPKLGNEEQNAITRINKIQRDLKYALRGPDRWRGILRRDAFARAIQGSVGIEGHDISIDDADAALDPEATHDAEREDLTAGAAYRQAMTYVLQLAEDPYFSLDLSLIRSLHYMILSYDLGKHPGQWRSGPIWVRRDATGEAVYEAPDASDVPRLMSELVAALQQKTNEPAIVRAAMAHLNLAMIHPFEDGNGRMAKGLQTLILEREGLLNPVFSSIEEYLGRNTDEYYRVLGEVGGGGWQPNRNARPWIRFCLKAHFECAQNFRTRNKATAELWSVAQDLIEKHQIPDRTDFGLVWAALGYRITNSRYRSFVDINENTASRDLKRLTDKGLLEAKGERRGRAYVAGPELRDAAISALERFERDTTDPFSDIDDAEPELPGLTQEP